MVEENWYMITPKVEIARFNNEKLVYTDLIHVEIKQLFLKIAIC